MLIDKKESRPHTELITENQPLQTLHKNGDDTLWFSPAAGGIYSYSTVTGRINEVLLQDNHGHPLTKPLAYHYQLDSFNNLWIATAGHGLIQLNHYQQNITYSEETKRVFATLTVNSGLYLGLHSHGLHLIESKSGKEKKNDFFRTDSDKPATALSLWQDEKDKNLWIGTDKGVKHLSVQGELLPSPPVLSTEIAHAVTGNRRGRLWFALRGKIARLNEDDKVTLFSGPDSGLKGRFFTALSHDSRENLWVAGQAGLFLFDKTKELFRQIEQTGNIWITHINTQEPGVLYLSAMQGFYRYDIANKTLDKFPEQSLGQAIIASFWDKEVLWVLSKSGLQARTAEGSWFIMNQANGLAAYHFNYGAASLKRGILIAGAEQGVARFDLSNLLPSMPKARVFLSSADFGGDRDSVLYQSSIQAIKLPPHHAPLTLNLGFNDLSAISNTEYRFRIAEGAWSSWNTQAGITLASLDPGQHNLESQARVMNRTPSEVFSTSINVERPWHAHPAVAITLSVLFFIAVFFSQRYYYRIKNQRLIKKQKELEGLVAEKTAHLRDLDRYKTEFFCNITHEIRTPLTLNIGSLQFILEKYSLSDHVKSAIKQAMNNAKRLMFLVNQILDVNRYDVHEEKLNINRYDLKTFLVKLADGFTLHAAQQGIQFKLDLPGDVVPVAFDPEKMERIVFNLMANAFKFTPEKGSIFLQLCISEQLAVLSVQDTGVGISPDHLPRLFDRFFSHALDGGVSYASSGIGLSIVKTLVEQQNGTIEVESQLREGSVFSAKFPLANGKQNAVPLGDLSEAMPQIDIDILPQSQQATAIKTSNKKARDRATVLIVEDNHELRQLLIRLFTDKYNVLEAENGQVGLQVLRRYVPDLVICDVMMPQMSGFELVSIAKNDPETNFIPIFLLTASQKQGNEHRGFQSGADDYIEKPFDTLVLSKKVENYFNTWANRRTHLIKQQNSQPLSVKTSSTGFKKMIEAYVYNNIGEVDVADLAKHLKLDSNQLYRRIRKEYDLSPQNYIREQRLIVAAGLLASTEDLVSAIAYQVGFSNLSYFTRSFKEKYGLTPNQYRSKH